MSRKKKKQPFNFFGSVTKEQQEKGMRYSLRKQLTVTFILLNFFVIAFCFFVNLFFLEKYYLSSKKKELIEVYQAMNRMYEEGKAGESEFDEEMMRLCGVSNISFIITDSSSNTIKTSFQNAGEINRQLRDVILERNNEDYRVIEEVDAYRITYMKDRVTQDEYLTMWGNIDSDNFFMLRTPVESIKDSVRLSNVFLFCVGTFSIVISAILIYFITKRITNPLLNLADLSARMADLNFEERYEGGCHNEIAVLGENFNLMSGKLEETIRELKTANLELLKDIETKDRQEERRSEFLANVSHELKTPIALIQGYAEGLKEGISEDPESREYYCDVIMDETQKMNHLVKRLISLNGVESGSESMVMERFDLSALIVNCIASTEILSQKPARCSSTELSTIS